MSNLFGLRIGLVSITNIIIGLSGLILLPVLTKNLTIDEYGMWVQMMVTVGLIAPNINLGMESSVMRFLGGQKTKEDRRECFYSIFFFSFFINIIILSVLFLLSKPFSDVVFNGQAQFMVVAIFITLFESLYGMCQTFFKSMQRIKKFSLFNIVLTYGGIATVWFSLISGYGLIIALISFGAIRLLMILIMLYFIRTDIGIVMPSFSGLKGYFLFSFPTLLGNISTWVLGLSDRYLIGYYLGLSFVGYYSPAYTIGGMILMFITPFNVLLLPILSKLYDEGDYSGVGTYLKYTLKYFLMLAIPAAFGLIILSKEMLTILSTSEIAAYSYVITPFVVIGLLLYGVSNVFTKIFFITKRVFLGQIIIIVSAVINFGLNIVFIPRFGLLGAAVSTLLSYTALFCFSLYFSRRYLKFSIDFWSIIKSVSASVIMSLFIIWFNPIGVLSVLFTIFICVFIYTILMILLGGFSKEDVGMLKSLRY